MIVVGMNPLPLTLAVAGFAVADRACSQMDFIGNGTWLYLSEPEVLHPLFTPSGPI